MDAITLRNELTSLLQETDKEASKYNRGHVFERILEFSKQEIPQDESLSMMYSFHLFQRILKSAQYGRMRLAKGFAQEARDLKVDYSLEATAAGMESLRLPAISYYHYVAEEYENALEGIVASYAPIHQLYAFGLKEAILMKIEQVTNEFRVLYSMGRRDAAMALAEKLAGFAITGIPSEIFPFALDEVMQDEGEKDQLSKYVLDCILFKWVGVHPQDLKVVLSNLQQILRNYPDSAYYRLAENLATLQAEGSQHWNGKWDLRTFFQSASPSMVKLLAIHLCFEYLQIEGQLTSEAWKAFENYNEKLLRIPEQLTSKLMVFHIPVLQ